MRSLTIEFDNDEAMKHFALWLCEAGEEDYWTWMECREQEEEGDITATSFKYWGPPGWDNGFMPDDIIRTECGRLDS